MARKVGKGIRYPKGWPVARKALYPNGKPGNLRAVLYLNHRRRLSLEGDDAPGGDCSLAGVVYDNMWHDANVWNDGSMWNGTCGAQPPIPVIELPIFTLEPQAQIIEDYASVTFTAEATKADTLQFYKRGVAVGTLSLTGSASYTFVVSGMDSGADIYCVATNADGSTQSASAVLTVNSYYYARDGLTQYYLFSKYVDLITGDVVSFDFKALNAPNDFLSTIIGGAETGWSTSKVSMQLGKWVLTRFTSIQIDGVTTVNGAVAPVDGAWHTLSLTIPDSYTLARLRALGCFFNQNSGSQATEFSAHAIRNFNVLRAGSTLRNLKLNRKSQGAFQYDPAFITSNLCTINPAEYFSKSSPYAVFAYIGVDARAGTFLIKFTNNGSNALWYRFADVANTVGVGETFHQVITLDANPNNRNYIATWGSPWEGVLGEVIFKEITAPMASIKNYNAAGWLKI